MSEKLVGNKNDKTFMILSAAGIVMLLDAHTWTTVNIFATIVEYNSFFMPLFVFVSGYFFSESGLTRVPQVIGRKARKFLVPFLFWDFFYLLLEHLAGAFGIIQYDQEVGFSEGICRAFTTGQICNLAGPLWFLPASFFTQACYLLLRKLFGKWWNEWAMLVLFVAVGCICISLSNAGWNTWRDGTLLIPLKVGFFLQFYELGVVYKKYLEVLHKRANNCLVMLTAVVVNIALTLLNDGNYSFVDLFAMSGFGHLKSVIFPFISSVSGIAFWLTISRILEPSLGNSKIVNMISDNTLGILEHHLFCYNLLNIVFWALSMHGTAGMMPFDQQMFQSWAVYRYEPCKQFGVFYIVAGLCGSLLITHGANCLRDKMRQVVTALKDGK